MKKFLRDLPEPLLTFKLGELFIISQSKCFLNIELESAEDRKMAIRLLCCMVTCPLHQLPKYNLDLLSAISMFMSEVASFSSDEATHTGNKMTTSNLALVLAPNILYSKDSTGASDSILAAHAVTMIFEQRADIFLVCLLI